MKQQPPTNEIKVKAKNGKDNHYNHKQHDCEIAAV